MKKDLSTKAITKCKDVFSDICNVNLFQSRKQILPEDLEPVGTEVEYRDANGELKEHRMDVRMKHRNSNVDIALFCLENQSGISNIMPIRDMGYLYSSYSEQIREIKEKNREKGLNFYSREIGDAQKMIPVISLILYYGYEDWTGPESVLDMLDISEEWRPFLEPLIANHQIRVVHLARQDEETRKKYQSDFRHVVDYLAYVRQKNKEKLKEFMCDRSRKIIHPQEYLDVMHAFTNDRRYLEIAESIQKYEEKGEEMNMCILLDMREEEGLKKGMQKGMQKGVKKGELFKMIELVMKKLEKGKKLEEIADALEESADYISQITEAIKKSETKDLQTIYTSLTKKC